MSKEQLFTEVGRALKEARASMPAHRVTAIGVFFKSPSGEEIRHAILSSSALTRRGQLTESAEKFFGRFHRMNKPFEIRVARKVFYKYEGVSND